MSEVTIEINDRKYRMACEDGQEQHLLSLGRRFNAFVDGFKDDFGEIGDNRLIVMAGIAIMDSLVELEGDFKELQDQYEVLNEEGSSLLKDNEEIKDEYSDRMSMVAKKIELLVETLSDKK